MNTRIETSLQAGSAAVADELQLSPVKVGMLIRLFAAGFAFICIFPLLSALFIAQDFQMVNRLAPSIFGLIALGILILFQGRMAPRRALLALWGLTMVIMMFHQSVAQVGIRGLVNTVLVLLVAVTGLIAGRKAGRMGVVVSVVYLTSIFALEQMGYIEGIQGRNSPSALGCLVFYAMMIGLSSALANAFAESMQEAVQTEIASRQARVVAEENMRHFETMLNFRTDLLTSVASKLKQPLLTIRQDLSASASELVDGQSRESFHKMSMLTRSIDETLDSLIDSVKAEVGELDLQNETFNLSALLSDIDAAFRPLVSEKGLMWVFTPAASLDVQLMGSVVHIRQQINHLLNVSLEHTQKGFIRLGASVTEADLSSDSATQKQVRFFVQDSSPGLPEHLAVDLLKRSSLLGAEHPLGIESGMRLSYVKSVALRLGGDMGIESAWKTGMTYWFTARLENV